MLSLTLIESRDFFGFFSAALSNTDYVLEGGQYLDALCNPFLPTATTTTEESIQTNVDVLEMIESGQIHEDLFSIPLSKFWTRDSSSPAGNSGKRYFTVYKDPIQALQIADARWSKHLWNLSLQLLQESPVKDVVALAP